MPIAPSTARLIEECAGLNARIAGRVGKNINFLVWAAPTAYRDPEETKLWHPIYTDKPLILKIPVYIYLVSIYTAVGIVRLFSYRGFSYKHISKNAPVLLVLAEEITDHKEGCATDYLIEEAGHQVDKLVFSRTKDIGERSAGIGIIENLRTSIRLEWAVLSDLFSRTIKGNANAAYLDACLIFYRWVVSRSWCFHADFYRLLNDICKRSGYKQLLLLHEMHFYSRVAYMITRENQLRAVTAQHAMIVPEKLWYFPQKEETKAGCPLPDVFFVYSAETADLLKPYYPGTDFPLCCSPRFRRWKAADLPAGGPTQDRRYITFASGIMAYDIEILVRAIKALLRGKYLNKKKIRLRLHPAGIIERKERDWIKMASGAGWIEISKASLKEELADSALVIGSNSTVLQEAILSGVPALGLSTGDYICAAVLPDSEDWVIPVEEISWERIEQQIKRKPDPDLMRRFRTNMGLFNTDLTTAMVYGI